jgi:integrase
LTAAKNKCEDLYRTGKLIPCKEKPLTFGEYAAGFWEMGSSYLENQRGRADITPSYIDNCKKMTANQILPFFGSWPLEKITYKDINKWLLGFKKREIKNGDKTEIKSYKNTYANTVLGTFGTMLGFAVEQELIKVNPCGRVRRLKNDRKKIEIIKVGEVQKLFPKNWKTVWQDKEIAYIANKLASLTGMRAGEIMGLKGEYVFDDYIYVCGSYSEYGYGPTKTKETRYIPLIPEMIALLRKLTAKNGNGYVFSLDGGAKPACRKYFYNEFHRALKRIGIDQNEITRRGLSIHSWRHFLNTELQQQGLSLQQVQAVTGHKSDRMTESYSHFDARQLADVMEAQQVITGTKKREKKTAGGKPSKGVNGKAAKGKAKTGKETGRSELKIVKMPEKENTAAQQGA